MNHYYNGVDNSAYLAHYGVLGMKWGQHLMAKAKSLTPSARRKAKVEKEIAEHQMKETARLKQSATNHKRQVARRQKMTVAQSDAELASIKRTMDNWSSSSTAAQKKYNDLFDEIKDNLWDYYESSPKSQAGAKAQRLYNKYKSTRADESNSSISYLNSCNDTILDALGYKYSSKNQAANRDIIEKVWHWD